MFSACVMLERHNAIKRVGKLFNHIIIPTIVFQARRVVRCFHVSAQRAAIPLLELLGLLFLVAHVNKGNPLTMSVFSFFNFVRFEAKLWIKKQASGIKVKTRYSNF